MANPTPILSKEVPFPPFSKEMERESPATVSWLTRFKLALKKRHSDISDATATITLAGADANKPPANTPGRLWYSTDTHHLFGDDGTVWTLIA